MAARPDYADALFNLALLLTRASSTYPPSKRGKTDAADAEAVAEAVTRPTKRFRRGEDEGSAGRLMLHTTRDLLVRRRPC